MRFSLGKEIGFPLITALVPLADFEFVLDERLEMTGAGGDLGIHRGSQVNWRPSATWSAALATASFKGR